jgi:hypothetical protein
LDDFRAGSAQRAFGYEALPDAKAVRLACRSTEAEVAVTVTGRPDGLDFAGEITPKAKTILSFALPAGPGFKLQASSLTLQAPNRHCRLPIADCRLKSKIGVRQAHPALSRSTGSRPRARSSGLSNGRKSEIGNPELVACGLWLACGLPLVAGLRLAACGWQHESVGPKGYVALFGAPLDQRPDHDPATTLAVTREGRPSAGSGRP